ncbi:glycoside hydrolase family 27 protein [Gluconacetobacter asukensis]|uniref:Alpha-galactosidase n=1 Tax=Gluconacetobacter asukensis TaxID=1017181 RepID=A0A7W4P2W0_9PROT|nr:glycoside hydrolase family 27 protein [Gluconacetobacter asukensis]MBB2172155.1 glycoside hydrolase family 27 protein [Gluconacetobacter asukensis]
MQPRGTIRAALLAMAALATGPARASGPPMGWNSWNHYGDKIRDADIRHAADALLSSGMAAAGYRTVIIDDGWQGQRDAQGNLQPDPSRFPDMKALADYIHGRGLRFGLYSSPGARTCAGRPGSEGHEAQDARRFAAWGVDYLKYDLCGFRRHLAGQDLDRQRAMMIDAYRRMGTALDATGRTVILALCSYGWSRVWEWAASTGGTIWRTTTDITPDYAAMMFNALSDQAIPDPPPGHWNDPDMLEIGNGDLTAPGAERTHLTLWVMLAAPLIAGNDLSAMTPETRAILTNRDVIAIDQDVSSHPGHLVSWNGAVQIWLRHLADGGTAIALVNTLDHAIDTTPGTALRATMTERSARELWTGRETGPLTPHTRFTIPARDVILLRLEGPSR